MTLNELDGLLGLSFLMEETIDNTPPRPQKGGTPSAVLCQLGGRVMRSDCSLSNVVLLRLCISEGCFSLIPGWEDLHSGDLSMDSC